jgi:hypothetical protein
MKMRWAKVRKAAKQATATAATDGQKPLVPAALPKAIAKKAAAKKAAAKKSVAKKASPPPTNPSA